jgi:hypothetical protein
MASQQEFDRLRKQCSGTLQQFIAEARDAERQMQHLRLPVGVDKNLKFTSQRRAEFEACHVYLTAVHRLDAFLKRQLEFIQ